MSEDKLNVLFVNVQSLSEFMGGFSVVVIEKDLKSLRPVSYLIFYSNEGYEVYTYFIIAKVSEIVLGENYDQYIVRASEARRVNFKLQDLSEEERRRYWEITENYRRSLCGYTNGPCKEVMSDMLLFEKGEKIMVPNAYSRDFLSLESATKLLAKSYGVDERNVSIQIGNRSY